MANVYAKIKQLIHDCDISYIDPLSYMKHFTAVDNSEKIILLYKKVSEYQNLKFVRFI